MTVYGDISPRTAAYAVDKMLERAQPMLNMARFAVITTIPKGKTRVCKWRRYGRLAPILTPLVEGVTPVPGTITSTDVTATIDKYGQHTVVTDMIIDTHEDPVLNEFSASMGETAGETQELIVYNVLRGGTAVLYSNGTQRTDVNTAINATVCRRALRALKQQDAKPLTDMISATAGVGTVPIPKCYICYIHPNVEMDLQNTTNFPNNGFTRVQNYGSWKPISDAEVGSFENIRFLSSTLYTPFANGGGALGAMLGGSAADVYPSIIVGKNSYGTVDLAGGNGLTPFVINPKRQDSDPHAQRGKVGFDMYSVAAILNDAFMLRVEHAVTA